MDLLWNSDLVENIIKARKNITVQDNGGTLSFIHKAKVFGYKQYVWFSKDAITNIIYLKNLIDKYRVTYDSIDQIFMVHKEDQENPNMEFKIHEYESCCYNPTDKAVELLNTTSVKKKVFS